MPELTGKTGVEISRNGGNYDGRIISESTGYESDRLL